MSSAICSNLDQSKILSSGNGLKVFATQSLLLMILEKKFFENILGKGKSVFYSFLPKILICTLTEVCFMLFFLTLSQTISGFYMSEVQSFSHSDFYQFEDLFSIFVNLKFSSANSFSLDESKIC